MLSQPPIRWFLWLAALALVALSVYQLVYPAKGALIPLGLAAFLSLRATRP